MTKRAAVSKENHGKPWLSQSVRCRFPYPCEDHLLDGAYRGKHRETRQLSEPPIPGKTPFVLRALSVWFAIEWV